MSDPRPIGVFDSGIGGLTVVKALRDLLPNENICYLGDTARVPYGPKSPQTVQRYAVELAEMLMRKNAKALVVACNTVSSVALPSLTKKFPVPVLGVIEPGARAALHATRNRHIGVIGTRATIRSGAYEKALRATDNNVRVSSRACPLLVPLIEEGLLNDAIARAVRRQIVLVDSAQNCARAVEEMLDQHSLRAAPPKHGKLHVALTDAADNFLNVARDALQL